MSRVGRETTTTRAVSREACRCDRSAHHRVWCFGSDRPSRAPQTDTASRRPPRTGSAAVFGDQVGPYRRPSVRYEKLAERTGEQRDHRAPGWAEWTWPAAVAAPASQPQQPEQARPGQPTGPAGPPEAAECVCGRVCVCRVPDGVVRSVASFVAEWHPTAVFDGSPAAERAEDATLCRCGQTFCGYRIFARTMRRGGAYVRA